MDNQNNQQNGYTNFNNYQPTTPPPTPDGTQPTQQPGYPQQTPYQQPMQQGYQPQSYQQAGYPQYPYQVPVQNTENKGTVLGIISIVLCCLSCCFAYLASVPAAILGLIGVIRNKKSVVSWIGLVLGVLLSIAWIAAAVYIMSNPDQTRELLTEAYGEDFANQMLESLYGFIIRLF